MTLKSLSDFRLVGGTALSLLLGHRISEDIDMFACKEYRSIPFSTIEEEITVNFPIVINSDDNVPGMRSLENNWGLHLFIGSNKDDLVKADILNWNDSFLYPPVEIEGIRLASIEEIAAMKLDVISRGGRKKDFWDLSEILDRYQLPTLLSIYEKKYPYYDIHSVIKGLTNFTIADNMPDPICFKGRYWDLVQQEMRQEVKKL